MSYNNQNMVRRRLRAMPLDSGSSEGLALAKARQWRPILKSKAQVKRRARGLRFLVKNDDWIIDRHTGQKIPAKAFKRAIRKYDAFQFPDLSLKRALQDFAAMGLHAAPSSMVPSILASEPIDTTKPVYTDKNATNIFAEMLGLNTKKTKKLTNRERLKLLRNGNHDIF